MNEIKANQSYIMNDWFGNDPKDNNCIIETDMFSIEFFNESWTIKFEISSEFSDRLIQLHLVKFLKFRYIQNFIEEWNY